MSENVGQQRNIFWLVGHLWRFMTCKDLKFSWTQYGLAFRALYAELKILNFTTLITYLF